MTYNDCEKYIDANRRYIKSTVQFGTAFFQYFGLLIAPNTFQIDRIENIFHRCAPSGKVADDVMSNEEALIEAGEINRLQKIYETLNRDFEKLIKKIHSIVPWLSIWNFSKYYFSLVNV